jgi:hypothetical protein
LRWRNVQEGRIKIEEAVYQGELGPTKTEGNAAFVAIPGCLQKELKFWREKCRYPGGYEFVFPSRKGTKSPEIEREGSGIQDVTFQSVTPHLCPPTFMGFGSVKGAQTELRHSNTTIEHEF